MGVVASENAVLVVFFRMAGGGGVCVLPMALTSVFSWLAKAAPVKTARATVTTEMSCILTGGLLLGWGADEDVRMYVSW